MSFFKSELIEGYKKNFCLICRGARNCKHIQRWKIESGRLKIPLFKKLKRRFYCGDNLSIKGFHSPDRFDDTRRKGKIIKERKMNRIGRGGYVLDR